MSGDRFRLEVKERELLGSPETRRLRKQGLIPGVLYGKTAARAIVIEERALRAALNTDSGLHAVLDVVVEGQPTAHPSILKDYQRHPVRGHVSHVDLQEVRLDKPIHAVIQVHLIGTEDAPGVREGGVLSQPATTINVEALPMEIPESIEVDVSAMEMGDTLRLEDVAKQEGVTFLDDPHEVVIATVAAPMREEDLEAATDEAAAEGLGDGDEAPEGAADEAAEGDGEGEGDDAAAGADGEPGSTDS
ncbi:MAG: 50S ribosomal protein L25 [Actinobacteria bacterium]|nr:50S ribosomal protein L25 [Actinomycetota bacterium]